MTGFTGKRNGNILNSVSFVPLWALLLAVNAFAADGGGTYRLYFLGGQSNMEGFGFVDELPAELAGEAAGVMNYTGKMVADNEPGGGLGSWDTLQPGYGTGFDTDGRVNTLSDRFGPELAFGKTMAELRPGVGIAILKYSRGGSALQAGASGYGTWDPDYTDGNGINQYDNALTAIRNATSQPDIDGDGKPDTLVPAGIIWMQGEADAYHSQQSADAYEANLQRTMDLLRAALRVDDLPVVIGRITDSGMAEDGTVMDYIETVQRAQQQFVMQDACAALVTDTDGFGYIEDGWHYDSQGFIRLGAAFAEAVNALERNCTTL